MEILVAGQPFATYVFSDPEIPRPYFAHLRAPGGIQVTRSYPPVAGQDPTDHGTFHPGLWMAFGDLSGSDNWRLKAPVRHEGFTEGPRGAKDRGSFAVRNRYLAADGRTTLATETCRYTLQVTPHGYLLVSDSRFRAEGRDLVFGDQEEMGLGLRVATPLTVTRGGEITDSDDRRNEAQIRGQQPAWCDYSGPQAGKRVGLTLMPDPANPLRSWYHVRDYGLLVANPFARKAIGGGAESRVVVPAGKDLRLRFGVLVHSADAAGRTDIAAAYRAFVSGLR